jgi:single-strand DNA-binding protein
MFGDINKVSLMGNITKDPDLRFTPSGAAVVSFSIATNRRYKVGEEWKDEVAFHNVVVWRSAEQLAKRIKKGTRIYIEGRLTTKSWDDKESGKKQYKTEVVADSVILIARYEGDNNSGGASSDGKHPAEDGGSEPTYENDSEKIDPNDLPF